ncbi:MAG: flagellar basal body rod protein FlgC [Verrucomicrobiia bacterium]|jgi:flagellar basal-body rod protein FlgC
MIDFLSGVKSTTAALTAERVRMDVISQNIANANTTQGADGKPYQRQQVVFETVLNQQMSDSSGAQPQPVRVARVEADKRPPLMVYSPGHPNADKNGMVAMPNINIHEEMADLITSSRSFEANLAVLKNAQAMAMQALSIGKR